ncbi:MAG: prepilin-type N-terminal cleavage/methylation domain-containing protein [Azoarcus sp.]|jgi:prepilin-type N-terminal cleavage/methylation domain-containing protein|nr:prepilin-type N-terminal cleavage/methylation domain-containing protein [Azoarcus sp.]
MLRMTVFSVSLRKPARIEHLSPCPKCSPAGRVREKVFTECGGFTLLELLAVIAILVVLAGTATIMLRDTDRRVEDEIARVELLRLAAALRQFHDDTGYWPKESVFRPATNCAALAGCAASGGDCGGGIAPGALPPSGADWFNDDANLTLLFTPPALCAEHPLAPLQTRDATARRGWNGPYLPLANQRWVDTENPAVKNVPAYGAGPAFEPDNSGAWQWRSLLPSAPGYNRDKHEFSRHARPFLFVYTPPASDGLGIPPRVIYAGMDGRFGGASRTSSTCPPEESDPDGEDDVVICL